MMTARDKAIELVDKYNLVVLDTALGGSNRRAKQCALIAVENEYNAKIQAYNEMSEFCPDVAGQAVFYANKEREQVRQEIEKL